MAFDVPTAIEPGRIIQEGMADSVNRLHGVVRGKVATLVTPMGMATYIRVIPTSHPHMHKLYGCKDVIWATVNWNSHLQRWECKLMNLPGGPAVWTETLHRSLGGAIRHARKIVQSNAGTPNASWPRIISEYPNEGPYPSDWEIRYSIANTEAYWRMVEQDLWRGDELDGLDREIYEDNYIPEA